MAILNEHDLEKEFRRLSILASFNGFYIFERPLKHHPLVNCWRSKDTVFNYLICLPKDYISRRNAYSTLSWMGEYGAAFSTVSKVPALIAFERLDKYKGAIMVKGIVGGEEFMDDHVIEL